MFPHAMVVIKSKNDKYGITIASNKDLRGKFFFTDAERAAMKLMEISNYEPVHAVWWTEQEKPCICKLC